MNSRGRQLSDIHTAVLEPGLNKKHFVELVSAFLFISLGGSFYLKYWLLQD